MARRAGRFPTAHRRQARAGLRFPDDAEIAHAQREELRRRVAVELERGAVHGERRECLDVEHEERQRAFFEEQTMGLFGLFRAMRDGRFLRELGAE